jgi:Arc/MetJ-type ribon-helix-helix transcriptional regulator
MDRQQVNVRLSEELAEALDKARVELQSEFGKIPNRSEVIRYALEFFLAQRKSAGYPR